MADIVTKNVGETHLNYIVKYIMVRLENLENTCKRVVTGDRIVCVTRCYI